MSIPDYTYYSTTYLGTLIASADFPRLALRATAEIDRMTFGRAAVIVAAATDTALIDRIKMATCSVAESLQAIETDSSGSSAGIKSETVGSYSVTYVESGRDPSGDLDDIRRGAALYLGSTGLLYRGFASEEYSGSLS